MLSDGNVIKALVALAICPGNRGACKYTAACTHACHGNNCARMLRETYSNLLDALCTSENIAATLHHTSLNVEQKVTDILNKLGVPTHLLGYQYVREAIIICINDDSMRSKMTTRLYPAIGQKFGAKGTRVRQAIVHAIEACMNNGDLDVIEEYFDGAISSETGQPSNGTFILRIADAVRLDL